MRTLIKTRIQPINWRLPNRIWPFLLAVASLGAWAEDWDYGEDHGPEHWGELSGEFGLCGSGHNQSPVDISDPISAELPALEWTYHPTSAKIVNNGHTVEIDPKQAVNELVVAGRKYTLKQFHFHTPSEHHLNGREFPLEAHFVHSDSQGNLAVVAVLFDAGPANPALESLWASLPEMPGTELELTKAFDASNLMPANRDYFRYNGSLTTPPCSEGVLWIVLKEHVTANAEEIAKFAHLVHGHNNRPVQPLYARDILE